MRNRAKCKLCKCEIESFHSYDFVRCKCGAIFVDSGEGMRCGADDWSNFLRIDDNGNEIIVKVKGAEEDTPQEMNQAPKPNKEELLELLDEMIKNIESLPSQAMNAQVTHYDLLSSLLLISSLFRSF